MQHMPKKRYSSHPNLSRCSYHTIRVLEIYKNAWKNYENRIFGVTKTKKVTYDCKTSRVASDFSKEILSVRLKKENKNICNQDKKIKKHF